MDNHRICAYLGFESVEQLGEWLRVSRVNVFKYGRHDHDPFFVAPPYEILKRLLCVGVPMDMLFDIVVTIKPKKRHAILKQKGMPMAEFVKTKGGKR